jgi:hypothetical protein
MLVAFANLEKKDSLPFPSGIGDSKVPKFWIKNVNTFHYK